MIWHIKACTIYTLQVTMRELNHTYNHSPLNCQRSAHLHGDQWVVDSLFLQEFTVCAELYNSPILESSDDVSIADSG